MLVDQVRFYDWGDSVVAHPCAAMLVPLGISCRLLKTNVEDPRLLRMRDAYFEGFSESGSKRVLVETLETACRVAKIARMLTWNRALRAALDQGDSVGPEWVLAPIETLVSLLDESNVGGA